MLLLIAIAFFRMAKPNFIELLGYEPRHLLHPTKQDTLPA